VFQFDGSGHTDTITDWNKNDTIQFQFSQTQTPLASLAGSVTVSLSDINGGTRVSFEGNTLTLRGVQASSLVASDFLLPPGYTLNLVNPAPGRFAAGQAPAPHSDGQGGNVFNQPS
jgi:hypothetical protein